MFARPLLLVMVTATLVVAVTGVVLTRSGRPFSPAAVNVHKLVDLGLLGVIAVLVVRDARVAPLSDVAITAIGIVAALQAVVLVSGGVITAMESPPRWATWVHRILSWAALAITVWWAVLFLA